MLLTVGLIAGCASGPAAMAPILNIVQISRVSPVRTAAETTVPVDYRIDIENPLDHSVTLVGVEIETVGESGGYLMRRVRHRFSQVVPAHGSSSINLRAWVQPLQMTDSGQVVTAVMLRGTARFESEGSIVQSAFTKRLAQ